MKNKYALIFVFLFGSTILLTAQQDELTEISIKEFYDILTDTNSKYLRSTQGIYNEWGDVIEYVNYVGTGEKMYFFNQVIIKPDMWGKDHEFFHLYDENYQPLPAIYDIRTYLKNKLEAIDTLPKITLHNSVIYKLDLVGIKSKGISAQNVVVNQFTIDSCSIDHLYFYNEPGKKSEDEFIRKHGSGDFFNGFFELSNSTVSSVRLQIPYAEEIYFSNDTIEKLLLLTTENYCSSNLVCEIGNTKITSHAHLWSNYLFGENVYEKNNTNQSGSLSLLNSSFLLKEQLDYAKNVDPRSNALIIGGNSNFDLTIDSCKISSENQNGIFKLSGDIQKLWLSKSKISTPLNINGIRVEHQIKFEANDISSLSLYGTALPEESYNVAIPWNQIKHHFVLGLPPNWEKEVMEDSSIQKRFTNKQFAGLSSEIVDEMTYSDLIATYTNMHNTYRDRGDRESANPCYAALKQIETRRWKYLYEQNKTFETFFRWQLNAFLSYFTDYGTNPAKAVIKSAWVVLLFSIFYLFFPSDWDVSNRSELLQKWKQLLSRKSQAASGKSGARFYFSTLAFVAYSGFIHLLNALTLSLNAFTTLGFGDIPTHGAARYVTIVQGFIGWFLLTIFSVSLINQVLG